MKMIKCNYNTGLKIFFNMHHHVVERENINSMALKY